MKRNCWTCKRLMIVGDGLVKRIRCAKRGIPDFNAMFYNVDSDCPDWHDKEG